MDSFARWSSRLCLAVVATCLLSGGSSPLYADWTIKQFEVVQGERGSFIDSMVEGLGLVALDQVVVDEIELYLSEVAAEYERLGFKEAQLDDKSQGGFAYKIFVYDYPDKNQRNSLTAPARYSVRCKGMQSNRYIKVDASRVLTPSGAIDPELYRNLAHELFHAVQAGYDLFDDNCDLGAWIVEGTADAVGIDTALKLRNAKPKDSQIRWGARKYGMPLRVADNDPDRNRQTYWTASLWRYIGEHQEATDKGGRAGTKNQLANYHYLDALFKRNLDGRAGEDTELRWLDEGLHEITGLGLERLYPNFVTTFPAYVPDRVGKAEYAQHWRDILFEGCAQVSLSATQPATSVHQALSKVGASCFELSVSIPGRVDVMIHAQGLDQEGLKSLSIGTAKGTKVAPAEIVELPAGSGTFLGHWLFRIPTDEPQVFVVSNIARDAAETRDRIADLHLALPTWQSNITKTEEQTQPGAKETGPTGGDRPDPTARRTGEELKTGMLALTSHVAGASSTKRWPDNGGCHEPFVFEPCGPVSTIDVMLVPGSFGQLGYVSGTGGALSQGMAMFSGLAEAGAGQLSADWMAAAERANSQDGSEVHIIIPLIDYGFSGSFNNAQITVTRANNGVYEAIGPNDAIPGQGIGYPLSGQVTIEQYTPMVLKGSFAAELVDMNQIPITENPNPTLPIHASVQGDFHIVATWQGDDRKAIVAASDEQLKQDLTEAFPFLGNQVDAIAGEMAANQSSGNGSDGSSASGSVGRCDCSCNRVEIPDPVCEPVCRASFTACAGEKFEPAEVSMEEVLAESVESAELRQRFQRLMEETYPGVALESTRDTNLAIFDGLETIEQQRSMLMFYEGTLQQR